MILAALEKTDYIKNRAAAALGIDVRRLNRLMSRLHITDTAPRDDI